VSCPLVHAPEAAAFAEAVAEAVADDVGPPPDGLCVPASGVDGAPAVAESDGDALTETDDAAGVESLSSEQAVRVSAAVARTAADAIVRRGRLRIFRPP
jgi:hypothetical protein